MLSIEVVQALLLLSICEQNRCNGALSWTYTGIALRTAYCLGLDREPRPTYSSKEAELRRRLFWSLYMMVSEPILHSGI